MISTPNTLSPSTLVTPLTANGNASTTVAQSTNPGNASPTSPSSSPGGNSQHGQVARLRHQTTSNSTTTRRSQYVELCVNTGQLCQSLAEIDVTAFKTDIELFRWIRKEYRALRSWRDHWYYLLRPASMEYVQFGVDRKERVHIFCAKNALPPQVDLDAGEYQYTDPPIPSNTFIHYLSWCTLEDSLTSSHHDWLDLILKRPNEKVSANPSPANKAYGMLVDEGPDIGAIMWTIIVTSTLVGGALVAFIVRTGDIGGAATVASLVVAILALLGSVLTLCIDRARHR